MTTIKPFNRQGNFTAVDNAVIDEIMPNLSGNEWKVLCFIIRKTVGWHKDSDGIAYSQFRAGTGISSNTTVQKSIDRLLALHIIEVGKTGHMADAHHYRLNKEYTVRVTESVMRPVTFSVTQPITDSVNTKESIKEIKENEASPIEELMDFFIGESNCRKPNNNEIKPKWLDPLVAIYHASGSDYDETKNRIKESIETLRNKGYTVANPGSIQNVAVALNGSSKTEISYR